MIDWKKKQILQHKTSKMQVLMEKAGKEKEIFQGVVLNENPYFKKGTFLSTFIKDDFKKITDGT